MAPATYTAITRADMAGWDAKCIDLVMEAQDLGWTGKMSSKGHMIMRAPSPSDATFSVSRRWTNGRAGMNMRSNLERWKRQQQSQPDFTTFDQITEGLEREQFTERLKAALTQVTGDLPGGMNDVMSAVYDVVLDREEVSAFAFQCAKEQRISHFGWMCTYPDDISEMRAWNVNWAVFDRRDGRVIDFGGPRHTDEGEEWTREFVEVQVAQQLARERKHDEPEPEPEPVVVDETDPERPHVCEVCGRTFKLPMNLGRHMSTVHKPEPLEFKGDPMEDGLDDLMNLTPSEPVAVQMDDHLTIVADRHTEHADPEDEGWTPLVNVSDGESVAAMVRVMDDLGTVARRMAMLENERGDYETRLANLRREYEDVVEHLQRQVDDLTMERDNARESVSALKQIVADL